MSQREGDMSGRFKFRMVLASLLAIVSPYAYSADAGLIEGAKKDGQVTWYTVQTIPQIVQPLVAGFEKKYGIKVNYIRANSNEVALRVINEARAGRLQADVVDGTSMLQLQKENLLMSWKPDFSHGWSKDIADPRSYWVATNYYINNVAVNTDLVPSAMEPKTWEDLLDPKWKGKMAWGSFASPSSGPGFVGLMIKEHGVEKAKVLLQGLARQNITGVPAAARQILDQVIAGEYALGIMMFNHHSVISAAKGAPVKWLPMSPSVVTVNVAAVLKDAPRPNAGKLFLDYMVSDEGQAIFRDNDYLPTNPNVPARARELMPDGVRFRGIVLSGEDIETEMSNWAKLYQEIFR